MQKAGKAEENEEREGWRYDAIIRTLQGLGSLNCASARAPNNPYRRTAPAEFLPLHIQSLSHSELYPYLIYHADICSVSRRFDHSVGVIDIIVISRYLIFSIVPSWAFHARLSRTLTSSLRSKPQSSEFSEARDRSIDMNVTARTSVQDEEDPRF